MAYTAGINQVHFRIEICLDTPEGRETIQLESLARPWAKDGVLYATITDATMRKQVGYPLCRVHEFTAEEIWTDPV